MSNKISCPVKVGQVIMFLYPRNPFYGVNSPLEPHFLQVSEVLDLEKEQIDPEEFEAQPLLLRGRWLIIGTKPDTGAQAEYFHQFMQHIQELPAETVQGTRASGHRARRSA